MQYSRNEVRQHILHQNKFSKFKNLCQATTSILVQKLFLSSSKPLSWSNLNTYPKKSSQCLPCTFKTFLNITPPPPHPSTHLPYHTIPYLTIPYHTIPYHTIPYHTIPYQTIPNQVVEEGRGPNVQESKGPSVPRSQGPKDQDILKSYSNTSLTLKKVHLVDNRNIWLVFSLW